MKRCINEVASLLVNSSVNTRIIQQQIIKTMPRVHVPKSSRAASAGVSSNPDRSITNPTAVHTNGKIDFTHISNILEDAVDVLGNDKSKFATLESC